MPTISKIVIGDSSTLVDSQRKIARSSKGRLWVTYTKSDGSHNHIYVSYSDNGTSWTEEKVSSVAATQLGSSIAIDSDDNLHLVWRGYGYGDYTAKLQIVYCKRTTTWGSIESITNIDAFQYDPAVAIDADDNVHVTWTGLGWGDYTAKRQTQYRKRTSSWQTQEAITNIDADQGFRSHVAIDSDNNIHVSWDGTGYGDYTAKTQIVYRKRTSSWQTLEEVTNIDAAQTIQNIAIDSDDNVHVVWYGLGWGDNTANYQVLYAKRTSSWSTTALTNKDANQFSCSIAIDLDDNIHVSWRGLGWGTYTARDNIQYRKYTDSWQAQVGITDADNGHTNVVLIYANYPTDPKTNIPKAGFAMVYNNASDVSIVYYGSSDLKWEGVTDTGNFFQLF